MKLMKKNRLDIQHIDKSAVIPEASQLQTWVDKALVDYQKATEIVIRIVDEQEMIWLNEQYRHKTGPTNILSFPFSAPDGIELDLLGDLVICAKIVEKEARQQQKDYFAHWAHIVIHGVLHLLGHDHIDDQDALQMETLEINILKQLDIPNPYL